MSDLFDTDLHELRDLADLVDHTDRTVDEILLAEAFNSGELHTYIDGKGQVALRVCARWERVRELFDSLQVKDPDSVYTVMVHLGWRSTDPIFAQPGDDSISEHDQAEHDAVMAELHDLSVPCPTCAASSGAPCLPTGPARSIPSTSGGLHPMRRAHK